MGSCVGGDGHDAFNPIKIKDAVVNTIGEILIIGPRAQHRHMQLGMVVVNYLQLAKGRGEGRAHRRTAKLTNVSHGLKLLAGELRCPIIALSQLNRKVENSNDSQKTKNVGHSGVQHYRARCRSDPIYLLG